MKPKSLNPPQTVFEQIKRQDAFGNEYWSARDIENHFVNMHEMVADNIRALGKQEEQKSVASKNKKKDGK